MSLLPTQTPPTTESGLIQTPADINNVIDSGPGENLPTNSQTPDPTPQPQTGPLFLGGRRFNSPQELQNYLEDQDRKVAHLENQVRSQTVPTPQAQPLQDIKISELLFEDPETALRIVEERAEKRVFQKLEKIDSEKETWNNFYSENRDLVPYKDIVEQKMQQNWAHLKDKSIRESLPELAKLARARVLEIRGSQGGTSERLPSGPAITAGSSGAPPPQVTVTNTPVDFASQIRKMQSRGRK
jgi:hypothetical protein